MQIFNFSGFWNKQSICGLDIIRNANKTVVVLTELPDNNGTSVTNAVEIIANLVKKQYNLPDDTIWIEHYPENASVGSYHPETFDLVTFSGNIFDGQFSQPRWERIKDNELKNFLL